MAAEVIVLRMQARSRPLKDFPENRYCRIAAWQHPRISSTRLSFHPPRSVNYRAAERPDNDFPLFILNGRLNLRTLTLTISVDGFGE
jgi:hypothetical protein